MAQNKSKITDLIGDSQDTGTCSHLYEFRKFRNRCCTNASLFFFLKLLVSWDFLKLESVEPEQKVSHQQMASFRKKTKSGRRRKLLLHFLCNKLRPHLSATHCTQVTAFL